MIFQRFSQINKKRKGQNLYSKNFVLKHVISYVYYVKSTYVESKKIGFSIL